MAMDGGCGYEPAETRAVANRGAGTHRPRLRVWIQRAAARTPTFL